MMLLLLGSCCSLSRLSGGPVRPRHESSLVLRIHLFSPLKSRCARTSTTLASFEMVALLWLEMDASLSFLAVEWWWFEIDGY